jgi:hypothetical protein
MPDNILDKLDLPQDSKNPNSSSMALPIAPELNKIPELTPEQKLIILKKWENNYENPPSIEELLKLAYPDIPGLDGRSKQGRLIKSFLASNDLKPNTKTEYKKIEILELNDDHKEFIKNNLNMKNHEIAQILWEKPYFTATSNESRSVGQYRDELRKQGVIRNDNGEETTEKYNPPKSLDRVCARINRNVDGQDFDYKKLTPTQKKQTLALTSYLNNMRFAHQMDLISNTDDKRLLENTFIKYIYDKPDLTQEDLDQYIILANEAVMASSIQRTVAMLEQEQERSIESDGKISMAIVEALKTSRDEYNSCIKRQQSLYKALDVERSKRMSERIGPQFTLLNIVEAFKNEESRKKMIVEAEKRNDKLKGEIKRLSDMDALVGSMWGADQDLFING